jgi:hypothetical protein
MATATKTQSDYKVTLELNRMEAETLATILGRVGGDPVTSRRKYSGAIYSALVRTGIPDNGNDVSELNRAIHFEPKG